ncbi:stage III sporulation protein AD [Clostridia bacterium]|nr:stage III sporulation protein AD [Clostridia bacterium]
MSFAQIAILGITASVLALTLKRHAPEMSLMIGIAASVVIFAAVVPKINAVAEIIKSLEGDYEYMPFVLKIIGIAYISEFAAGICSDAGEYGISSKVEAAGKVFIMIIAAPALITLLEVLSGLL